MTNGKRSQQKVFEIIVYLTEERGQPIAHLRTGIAHRTRGGIGPHVVRVLQSVVFGVSTEVYDALLIDFGTREQGEVMFV